MKGKHIPSWAASVPLIFILQKTPNRSINELMKLARMARSSIQDRVRILHEAKAIYISEIRVANGRAFSCYSAGSLPDAVEITGSAFVPRGPYRRRAASLIIKRDWAVSAIFGAVEQHQPTAIYGTTIHVEEE